jgi:hypothetical protein
MNELNIDNDLVEITCYKIQNLLYFIWFWHRNEIKKSRKMKLYKIYHYIVDNKLEIQDLFDNNDILNILNTYKADEGDYQGEVILLDIKTTLVTKGMINFYHSF